MDLAHFKAEAEKLARRATLLRVNGEGDPVAYWHGFFPGRPCISLRRDSNWLNVHLNGENGYVENGSNPIRSPVPLFAELVPSLPPVDAIFRLGSNAVESYLRRNDWKREDSFNDNFPDDVPAQYEKLWQANCPMYSTNAAAVCGGWHFPWPDGDFGELMDSELVVWTILDSEPWVEVFVKGDTFAVKQRVT